MPNKLQLKLLSNSGELLNVVNCLAGKISVLRASVPSDLRPYQRALGGSPGKENLVVTCDGNEYRAEEHIVIGFGEPSPTTGLLVRDFLAKHDINDSAADALLLQIGLENVAEKKCSDLSADQEARLRLIAATTDPERVLVLNDPFENISGQWRERAADLLATFARSRKALIVIPALSYRPESWIDNQSVERIEVGQTSQRTIGFGAAGSHNNALINEIRDKVRQEHQQASRAPEKVALATAAMSGTPASTDTLLDPTRPRRGQAIAKVSAVSLGVALSVWVGIGFFSNSRRPTPHAHESGSAIKAATVSEHKVQPTTERPASGDAPAHSIKDEGSTDVVVADTTLSRQQETSKKSSEDFVLDHYPSIIKTSLLDTARGVANFKSAADDKTQANQAQADKSGNLFSLLESASSKSPGAPAPVEEVYNESEEPVESESIPANASEEEARREEIRNRFLEAIRAAAERRQAEAEIEQP